MSKTITTKEWEDTYLPMTNHITNEGIAYETYGDELDYILQQDEKFVWTEMDGDDGVYIVNGYYLVNRIQYYITNVPWTEDISITVCTYKECECWNEDTAEGDPNCDVCYGDGNVTVWED